MLRAAKLVVLSLAMLWTLFCVVLVLVWAVYPASLGVTPPWVSVPVALTAWAGFLVAWFPGFKAILKGENQCS
jgi:hypothetical protein